MPPSRKLMRILSGALLTAACLDLASATACTVFALSRGGESVYGQNLDWREPLPALVVVNPRGVEKSILPWQGSWPLPRAGEPCPQWMQHQLDNFATVAEVLAHLDELRPDGEGWHYLVADRSGAAAVIEYLAGKPTVYTGDALPHAVLTNAGYAQLLTHVPMDKAFGGDIDIAAGDDSYSRFLKAAAMRNLPPEA